MITMESKNGTTPGLVVVDLVVNTNEGLVEVVKDGLKVNFVGEGVNLIGEEVTTIESKSGVNPGTKLDVDVVTKDGLDGVVNDISGLNVDLVGDGVNFIGEEVMTIESRSGGLKTEAGNCPPGKVGF